MRSGSVGAPCDRCVIVGAISRCGGNELLWRVWLKSQTLPPPSPRHHEEVLRFPSRVGELRARFWRRWRRRRLRVQSRGRQFHWQNLLRRAAPGHCGGDHCRRWEPVVLFFFVLVIRFCWCLSVFMRALHAPVKCTMGHVTEQGCNPMPSPQEWMEVCVLDIKIHTEASVLSLTNTTFSLSAVFSAVFVVVACFREMDTYLTPYCAATAVIWAKKKKE